MFRVKIAFCAMLAMNAFAAAVAGEDASAGALAFDAGGDFRIRQEIMHNIPGLPGAPGSMMPLASKKYLNHVRFRTRVWGKASWDRFTLYARVVNELREHVVKYGIPRKERSYNFPDEVMLDNLYLDAKGLYDGFLDFRLGRQDLYGKGGSAFGLPRLISDGTPFDGSRSCYADMARFTFNFEEKSKLDVFALYNNGRNQLSWGNRNSRSRPLTALHPRSTPERDQWGGGLVWSDSLSGGTFPYKLYAIHKHDESCYAPPGRTRTPEKQITTVGINVLPELNEYVSFEFDVAKQFGTLSDGNAQAGGEMAYAAVEIHESAKRWGMLPYARLSMYYLSGDRNHGKPGDNDTAWDPLWALSPMDSELFQYGTLYGLGYWSNIAYPKVTVGANFGPRHSIQAYTGPLFAAVQDGDGHADGSRHGMFKGALSAVRYDFPLRLAKEGAIGCDRIEIFGHVMAELFNPGDYYDTSRPSYFIRWELLFSF